MINLGMFAQAQGGKKFIVGITNSCVFHAYKLRKNDDSSLKELDKDGQFCSETYKGVLCHRTLDITFNNDFSAVIAHDGSEVAVTFYSTFPECIAQNPSLYAKRAAKEKEVKEVKKVKDVIPAGTTEEQEKFLQAYYRVFTGVARLTRKEDTLTAAEQGKLEKGEAWLKKAVSSGMELLQVNEEFFIKTFTEYFAEQVEKGKKAAAESKKIQA